MKVSLTQENLHKALASVSRVVGSRTTLPVLANVLLKTDANRLKLSTTNLEMGINYWIGAKVEAEGSLTVPARLLGEYVASLPSDTIQLGVDKQALKITANHYQSVINGIDPEEFPTIPNIVAEPLLTVASDTFRNALSQVVLVASSDDARPVLNGIYLYTEKDELYIVATDSYRLAERKIKLTNPPKDDIKVIVPARTMQELLRMLGDTTSQLEVVVDENQVMFRFESVELISRLIDGQFPNYRQLIPESTPTFFKIDTSEFINIAKVASLFARENAGSVTLTLDTAKSLVRIRSIASQVGENTSEATVETSGEDAEVALNCRYILDALSVVKTPQVTFGVTGKINPCLLRPVGEENYLHVIMPLRS